MLILDLCGGSGAWSQPYREAGYCVEIVDPVVDGRDVRLWQATATKVHGILAAPPCTVWSYARNRYPPDEAEMLASLSVVDACLRIVVVQQPRFWALENPINKLRRYLGPPRLTFRQWEYGDSGQQPNGHRHAAAGDERIVVERRYEDDIIAWPTPRQGVLERGAGADDPPPRLMHGPR